MGIKEVISHGSDMLVRLTDGKEKRFMIGGGFSSSTQLGGGGVRLGSTVTVSTTPPPNPSVGDVWFDIS